MLVCIDKITCVRMYDLIYQYWQERMKALTKEIQKAADHQEEIYRERHWEWMNSTRMAVVI